MNLQSHPFAKSPWPGGEGLNPELFRQVMIDAPDAILILESDGQVVWANPSAMEALLPGTGVSHPPARWTELWSGSQRRQADTFLANAVRPLTFTGQRHSPLQMEQWWECSLTPLNDGDNRHRRILCVARDITMRRANETALHIAEERYRLLFENAVDGILQLTGNGTVVLANAALARILGMGSAQMLVQTWPRFAHECFVSVTKSVEFLQLITTQPEVKQFEFQLRRRHGSQIWASISARALRDDQGNFAGYEGSLKDISPRRNADQLIREQANLINRARDAILVADLADRLTLWNHGAETILGWTAAETLGRPLANFIGPIPGRKPDAGPDEEWHGEMQMNDRSGRPVVLLAHTHAVCNEEGRPVARLYIASDITEKKQLEERAFHAQRMEGIGMLAAGIAHNLNNILAPILMAAPMLREEVATPRGHKFIAMMEQSAGRAAALVKQFLSFAHQAGGERQPLQVKHVIHDLAGILFETFPKSIRCEQLLEKVQQVLAARGRGP